ncbi:unnamed protein product, partial [Mesorhabditis belari]|uniref:G-protein coupled receptors family 1 profile domain-containing protein n=1 Tax=Mesorhabditis belari TaxID=2138241 RepID=A0AAF3FCN7_9BILA
MRETNGSLAIRPSTSTPQNFDDEKVTSSIPFQWSIFLMITVVGILLNLSVFWRRRFSTKKRQSTTTQISLQLLCTMAAADTLCLAALFFLLTLRFWGIENTTFFEMACKLDVFIIHAASSFSIWCWLVLSAVRYVAIYRPYTHLKMHKEPHLAVIGIAVFCCISESWLLYDITYIPETRGCDSRSDEVTGQKLQMMEMVMSYFLPLVIITILDLKVLFCRTVWFTGFGTTTKQFAPIPSNGDLVEQEAKVKRRAQQLKILRRCLAITIFDLGMNLPSYVYRLYLCMLSEEEMMKLDVVTQERFEFFTQIMYFAQFSLNALYLVYMIYDTPKRKGKIPVSRKIDCLECLKQIDELRESLGGDLTILTLIDLERFLLKKCMGPRQIPRPDILRKSCQRRLNNQKILLEEFVAKAKAGKSVDFLCHNVFHCVDY